MAQEAFSTCNSSSNSSVKYNNTTITITFTSLLGRYTQAYEHR